MFVVQYNMMNEDSLQKMKAAIDVLKIPHVYVGVIPFSHEITSDVPLVGTDFLVYGSTLMTKLTHELGWVGNYFDPHSFRYEVWNAARNDMLNSGAMSLIDAVEFLKRQDPKSVWFTRPCEDLKQYSGMVIEADECWEWFEDAMACESSGSYQLSSDTAIVLCEPRNIQAEYRWFIVNGKVVSGSMYRFNGNLQNECVDSNPYMVLEAQTLADAWLPHRNCVMDLALVDDELKVIEFNTINSSGLYCHNTEAIIKALWEDFCDYRQLN